MGIFDSIQNLLSGATDSAQGTIGDVVGGLTDNQAIQDMQERASTVTDGATKAVSTATEQGQTAFEDIKQNIGL